MPTFFTTNWSVLRVSGPDAVSFLHNMCTNDVKKLAVGNTCEALFTDVKAHAIAHAIVCRTDEGCLVVVTSPRADELATHLDRYHIREDLELATDKSPVVFASDQAAAEEDCPENTWRPVVGLGASSAISTGTDSEWIERGNWQELSEEAFERLRIEQQFPLDGVDVDERNLPQELNRDAQLISFTKGCYLGQETVARIDALGRVNQLLVPIRFNREKAPTAGEELVAEAKVVGRITSASPVGVGLAYVRRGHSDAGTVLNTQRSSSSVTIEKK